MAKTDYPDFFRQATVAGILYRLPDFVVDTESLLHVLVKNQGGHIFKIDSGAIEFDHDDRHYRLVGLEPMTALSGEGVFWDVYIRVEPASGLGNGTSAYGFDAIVIQDAIESLMP
ncbi:MAG: hypothetical protein IIC02_11490 [Planctomycetes bacterium]|nr:hypothetical protein [Planctomycetota bacterium]